MIEEVRVTAHLRREMDLSAQPREPEEAEHVRILDEPDGRRNARHAVEDEVGSEREATSMLNPERGSTVV